MEFGMQNSWFISTGQDFIGPMFSPWFEVHPRVTNDPMQELEMEKTLLAQSRTPWWVSMASLRKTSMYLQVVLVGWLVYMWCFSRVTSRPSTINNWDSRDLAARSDHDLGPHVSPFEMVVGYPDNVWLKHTTPGVEIGEIYDSMTYLDKGKVLIWC